MKENKDGSGHIVKMPFTTNQKYQCLNGFDKVLKRIKKLHQDYGQTHQYCFLQAFLENKMEYKVVCFDGQVQYIGEIGHSARVGGSGHSARRKFKTPDEVKSFAQEALTYLRNNDPSVCANGIFRVDVMYCKYLDKMIVNEFESLEAVISASPTDFNKEVRLKDKMADMYFHELERCLL